MDSHLTPSEALERAVTAAGSQSAFARALGVSQPTVWTWLQSSKRLPAEHVLNAERFYGVSRHDLRPDIYPRDLAPASGILADDDPETADPASRIDVVLDDQCCDLSLSAAPRSLVTRRSFPRDESAAETGAPIDDHQPSPSAGRCTCDRGAFSQLGEPAR